MRPFNLAALGNFVALLAAIVLCTVFPSLDLGTSNLFYTPGVGFEVNGVWYERVIYRSVQYLLILVGLALILAWAYGRRIAPQAPKRVTGRQLAFLLVLLAIGPGLLVNEGMKENWGRSRPVDLAQFGGDKEFSRAFELSDQGGKAFPSGHAAAAFYLVAVAYTVARRRRLWIRVTLAYGLLVGALRIASGGHFLSDVLVSALIVWILAIVLYRFFFGRALGGDGEPP